MWCVACHTFWHWETGRILTSAPHNPDHREWLAQGRAVTPRETDDLPCGGIPDAHAVSAGFVRDLALQVPVRDVAHGIMSALEAVHVAQHMRHDYPLVWNDDAELQPLRIAHLLGEVTREAFASSVERAHRTHTLRRDVGAVLEAFVLCSCDVLQRFVFGAVDCVAAMIELSELRDRIDAVLADLASAHARKVPRLDASWGWLAECPYVRQR